MPSPARGEGAATGPGCAWWCPVEPDPSSGGGFHPRCSELVAASGLDSGPDSGGGGGGAAAAEAGSPPPIIKGAVPTQNKSPSARASIAAAAAGTSTTTATTPGSLPCRRTWWSRPATTGRTWSWRPSSAWPGPSSSWACGCISGSGSTGRWGPTTRPPPSGPCVAEFPFLLPPPHLTALGQVAALCQSTLALAAVRAGLGRRQGLLAPGQLTRP